MILDSDASHVLLIQRRDNGRWEPPGGVLELSESIEAGLRREVREETGVEIEVEGLSGVYKNMAKGIVALVFRCKATTAAVSETKEAAAIVWQPVSRLSELLLPAYAVRVQDALVLGPARTRVHDGVNLVTEVS